MCQNKTIFWGFSCLLPDGCGDGTTVGSKSRNKSVSLGKCSVRAWSSTFFLSLAMLLLCPRRLRPMDMGLEDLFNSGIWLHSSRAASTDFFDSIPWCSDKAKPLSIRSRQRSAKDQGESWRNQSFLYMPFTRVVENMWCTGCERKVGDASKR
jgi:hypothetical protein